MDVCAETSVYEAEVAMELSANAGHTGAAASDDSGAESEEDCTQQLETNLHDVLAAVSNDEDSTAELAEDSMQTDDDGDEAVAVAGQAAVELSGLADVSTATANEYTVELEHNLGSLMSGLADTESSPA
eukprot:6133-Heterococcus_DN1.PRE.1